MSDQFPPSLKPIAGWGLCLLLLIANWTSLLAQDEDSKPDFDDWTNLRGNFANSLKQFENEKEGHVVFLGGSITQNANGHSKMIPEWLQERFPETEFTFTNAGLSSTCSVTGAFRLKSNVLSEGPVDLLIVEFAVNDDQDAMHARDEALRGMEGVVRGLRAANPSADILMVQYVNPPMLEVLAAGETPTSIAAHEEVARRYEIPSVNVAQALHEGAMTWEEYGGTHPKQPGYRFASDLMIHALEKSWQLAGSIHPLKHPLPDRVMKGSYSNGRRVKGDEAAWMGGWTMGPVSRELLPEGQIRGDYEKYDVLVAEEAGAMLTFDFLGNAVGAFVLAGPDAAMLETSLNGADFQQHELRHYYSEKLNYPRTVMFYNSLPDQYHQLTIRVAPREEDAEGGERAAILFFSVND